MAVRIETVGEPFDEPGVALSAIAFLERAQSMGLLGDLVIRRLDRSTVREATRRIASQGIAVGLAAALGDTFTIGEARAMLDRLNESLEGSPAPQQETAALTDALGTPLLARLVGVSPVTVNRWLTRARTAEGQHAGRLHWLSGVVSDLRSAYNPLGMQRWFMRPRAQLGGRSPIQVLGTDWDPDGEEAARVRELAAWLTSPAAT